MKSTYTIIITILFIALICNETKAQSKEDLKATAQETLLVTFECKSCTKRNKFAISGPERHTFKKLEFPLKKELRPGDYKMTYWQNRVQQIHLPFSVSPDSENVVIVKD